MVNTIIIQACKIQTSMHACMHKNYTLRSVRACFYYCTMGNLQLLLISATGSVATAQPMPSMARGYGGTSSTILKKTSRDVTLLHYMELEKKHIIDMHAWHGLIAVYTMPA